MPEISDDMVVSWMTWLVTRDDEFLALYSDVIKPDQFSTVELTYLFSESVAFYAKYGEHISGEALTLLLEEKPDVVKFDKDLTFQLWEEAPEPSKVMRQFVIDRSANWFKRKLMRAQMNQAVDLLVENRVDDARDLLSELTMDVAAVGEKDFGHAGTEQVEDFIRDLLETYEDTGTAISCGLKTIDKIMRGGLRPGQLGVWMGSPGQGKSQVLNFVMRTAYMNGLKVVYYTLEMDYKEVTQRLWSGITDISVNEMDENLPRACAAIRKAAASADKKGWGEFVVKSFPTRQATVSHLGAHLASLERKLGWKADLVIVDYADILKAGRSFDVRRDELATIYEDLRGLATTLGVPIWTACQTNRIGSKANKPGIEHMSDSWDKAKIADYIFALAQTEAEKEANEMKVHALKVRNNAGGDPVEYGIDFGRSMFFDRGLNGDGYWERMNAPLTRLPCYETRESRSFGCTTS